MGATYQSCKQGIEMSFPAYEMITSKTLRDLQLKLALSNKDMSELVGISEKTWLNRISAPSDTRIKLLSKLEYAYLVSKANKSKRTIQTTPP